MSNEGGWYQHVAIAYMFHVTRVASAELLYRRQADFADIQLRMDSTIF